MKRQKRALAFAVLLPMLMLLHAGVPAAAAQSEQTSGEVGFYVRPVLPQNQRDGGHGYFDLRVRPGQAQALTVEVYNQTGREITVEVGAITASSGRHGVIDYTTPNVRDESLVHAFCDIAQVEKDTLTIPAHGSANAVVRVTMPRQVFDGVVLGGLVFTKALPQAGEGDSSAAVLGASVQNRYSYVVGVVLNETDTLVEPEFEVYAVRPEVVNHAAAAVHYIRNRNAAIVKNLSLSIRLLREGELFMEVEREGMDMAPCSVLPFAPDVPKGHLPAGSYVSETELRLNGRVWRFENSFTITGDEAQQLNGELAQSAAGLPAWVVWLIAGLGLAVLGLVLAVLYQRGRRKNSK